MHICPQKLWILHKRRKHKYRPPFGKLAVFCLFKLISDSVREVERKQAVEHIQLPNVARYHLPIHEIPTVNTSLQENSHVDSFKNWKWKSRVR